MYMLIWEWKDEETGYLYDQSVEYFYSKHALVNRYKEAKEFFAWAVDKGRLEFSAGESRPLEDFTTL